MSLTIYEDTTVESGETLHVNGVLTVEENLTVNGTVTDTPNIDATDPRVAVKKAIEDSGLWPYSDPVINFSEQVTHKAKENERETAIYVSTENTEEIDRFSADGVDYREDETVSADIWVLNEEGVTPKQAAREYRTRVINHIKQYASDNYSSTDFHRIEPDNASDFRQEHVARQTDHYIYSVEVATHRLRDGF